MCEQSYSDRAKMSQMPLEERYVDLGVKAIDADDLEKALRYLNRALTLNAKSYLAYYNRGVAYDLLERLCPLLLERRSARDVTLSILARDT